MKQAIECAAAPAAIGPYSQAIGTEETVFVSGQLGMVAGADALVGPEAALQAQQALANLVAILRQADLGPENVVKVTVYLTDLGDFQAVNTVYTTFFAPPYPARACVGVAALPKGAKVEIEAIAVRG